MTREIKFRCWDKESKGFFYSYDNFLKLEGENWSLWYKTFTNDMKLLTNMNKGILQQFTGLKDKNGKEIYEGDIVKGIFSHKEERIRLIEWEKNINSSFVGFSYSQDDMDNYEIIGNKFENPELLK